MKKNKNIAFYIIIISVLSSVIYWIASQGKKIEVDVVSIVSEQSQWNDFLEAINHNLTHPLALLLIQIMTIVLVARIFGWVFRKIGQPSVIGEIIAGIALGPSLFGMYFPDTFGMLFPKESLGNLQFLSQIGLILFMFVIGMELDLKILRNKIQDAVIVSHTSIILPFALAIGLSYFIYDQFAPEGTEFLSFALFMGVAMSIAAFPVLARITQERGIHKTKLGSFIITCAATDDITAWCLLATVIAIVKAGSFWSSLYIIALVFIYVFMMMKLVRPFLKRIGDLHPNTGTLSKGVVAIFLLTLIVSAYLTEIIGIHALFGAFMAGVIMPDNAKFRHIFIEKVEDVAVILFLPLFFVYTGLRTQIGLLDNASVWEITGWIVLLATLGKFSGSALSARVVGQNWRESLTIGALMNTRGLMELIVLNIGFDLGVLSKEVFAMMVIMALVTTFMTGPLLDLINLIFKTKVSFIPEEVLNSKKYKVLFSFKDSKNGNSLLKIANSLVKKQPENTSITAMHLVRSEETHSFSGNTYEEQSFAPIVKKSNELAQPIVTLFKVSNDIDSDIVEIANKGEYDLLLIGLGESIFKGTLLGKFLGFTTRIVNPDRLIDKLSGKERLFENSPFDERTRSVMVSAKVPVGLYVDKGLENVNKLVIPFFSNEDFFLIEYIQRFIHNNDSQAVIFDTENYIKNSFTIKEIVRSIEQSKPNHITIKESETFKKDFLKTQDLMLISLDSWKKLVDLRSTWIDSAPSTLILRP